MPLPSLLMPPPPTSTGAGPSGLAGGLRIGTSLLEGATSTMGAINTFRGMASSGKGNPLAG